MSKFIHSVEIRVKARMIENVDGQWIERDAIETRWAIGGSELLYTRGRTVIPEATKVINQALHDAQASMAIGPINPMTDSMMMAQQDPLSAARQKLIDSFYSYCKAHPQMRLWQALLNWSGFKTIMAEDLDGQICDTFHMEGRNINDHEAIRKARGKQ